jgi:hypothetical protein
VDNEGNWKSSDSPFAGGDRPMQDRARRTADKARSQVRSLANAGREEVAQQIAGVARALRRAGDQMRDEEQGQIGHYGEMLGEQVERVATYLDQHDADDLVRDVESFARRRPMLFLGGCVALGFVVGRFFKASPPEAREGGMSEGFRGDMGSRGDMGGSHEGGFESHGDEGSGWLARRDDVAPTGAFSGSPPPGSTQSVGVVITSTTPSVGPTEEPPPITAVPDVKGTEEER